MRHAMDIYNRATMAVDKDDMHLVGSRQGTNVTGWYWEMFFKQFLLKILFVAFLEIQVYFCPPSEICIMAGECVLLYYYFQFFLFIGRIRKLRLISTKILDIQRIR